MQPVNNNSNASAANANSNSTAANVNSVNASNNSNSSNNNSNAAKVKSNGNVDKVSLSKGGRKASKKARMLAAEQARDTIRNKRNGKKSRSNAAEKAGQTEKSSLKQDRNSAGNQIRVTLTGQKDTGVRNLFDKFTKKNAQTIKKIGVNKPESKTPAIDTDKNTQVSGNPDKKTPAASEQIVIAAPKGPALGLKAENDNKPFNIPALKKDDGNTEDSKEDKQVGNVPDLFKEKDNNGNGPMLGIGNNGNDKSNEPPGLLKKDDDDKDNGINKSSEPYGQIKKDDDDKDKGPVASWKNKNKNKGPVAVGNQKDKEDKIHDKPDTVQEIKGALSKMWDLLEELREKNSSKSKEDSADEQKSYGFGAGMVSLNTSKSFQSTSTSSPTYGKPIGAAKGSAIHINGGSDSKPGQSGTTIKNDGGFSLGSSNNRAGALSTYRQIQDIA